MPATSFQYAYLIANFFFLAVWLLVFLRAKHLRRLMLIMSLITASFGPISEIWYFADYWKPEIALPLPIGIGSAFLVAGIMFVIYFLGQKPLKAYLQLL